MTGPPARPPEREPPTGRGLMSRGFWAMMILCFLFIVAGAALVLLGPALWPHR